MSDVLAKVDNVSKRFCCSLKSSLWTDLQDLGSEIGGRRHGWESLLEVGTVFHPGTSLNSAHHIWCAQRPNS